MSKIYYAAHTHLVYVISTKPNDSFSFPLKETEAEERGNK